jgi:iron-sulfur cluster repair protein YtfE (RIC family)
MKFGDVDIALMSINESIRFFTGAYHQQMKTIVNAAKIQLSLAMENRIIRHRIKPIAEHFYTIENAILSHISQEAEILTAYLQDKNLGVEFAGVSMYAVVKEHDSILKSLEKLGRLCNQYNSEESDHVLLKLTLAKLNNFEQDLRRNIYFENNIFFPKILKTSLETIKK